MVSEDILGKSMLSKLRLSAKLQCCLQVNLPWIAHRAIIWCTNNFPTSSQSHRLEGELPPIQLVQMLSPSALQATSQCYNCADISKHKRDPTYALWSSCLLVRSSSANGTSRNHLRAQMMQLHEALNAKPNYHSVCVQQLQPR